MGARCNEEFWERRNKWSCREGAEVRRHDTHSPLRTLPAIDMVSPHYCGSVHLTGLLRLSPGSAGVLFVWRPLNAVSSKLRSRNLSDCQLFSRSDSASRTSVKGALVRAR
jgi:hypothetical protein